MLRSICSSATKTGAVWNLMPTRTSRVPRHGECTWLAEGPSCDAHHRCRSAVGVYEGNFAQRGPISSEVVAMPCILASPIGTAPTESFLLRALVVSLRSPPSVRKQPGALPTIHVTITFFSNSLLNGFSRFCTPRRVPNARSGVCPESARLGYPSSRDRCVVKRRDQPSYR